MKQRWGGLRYAPRTLGAAVRTLCVTPDSLGSTETRTCSTITSAQFLSTPQSTLTFELCYNTKISAYRAVLNHCLPTASTSEVRILPQLCPFAAGCTHKGAANRRRGPTLEDAHTTRRPGCGSIRRSQYVCAMSSQDNVATYVLSRHFSLARCPWEIIFTLFAHFPQTEPTEMLSVWILNILLSAAAYDVSWLDSLRLWVQAPYCFSTVFSISSIICGEKS